jgi:hypothetical protein
LSFNEIEDAHYDSRLLGHDKLDTTARYTRVATGMIAGIESPLDLLSQPRKKVRISYPKLHHYVFSPCLQRGAASREIVRNVFSCGF